MKRGKVLKERRSEAERRGRCFPITGGILKDSSWLGRGRLQEALRDRWETSLFRWKVTWARRENLTEI